MKFNKIMQFSIGLVGSALITLITFPILAWYFPQEVIGKLSMLIVINGFVVTIFSLGLDQAYIREYNYFDNKSKLFFSTILPGFIFLILICIIILITIGDEFSFLIVEHSDYYFSFLIIFLFISSFLNRFLCLIFRMEEKGILYSLSQAIPKVLFLIMVVFYVNIKSVELDDLILIQFISVFVMTILSIVFLFDIFKKIELLSFTEIYELLRYSIPLVIGSISYWGLLSIDRVFIAKLSDYNELAIFSVAMSFAGAANLIQSIFSTIWVPTVYKWAKEIEDIDDCKRNVETVNSFTCIISVIITSLACMLSWVIKLVVPDDYSSVIYIIPCCMIPALYYIVSETTVTGINISKKTRYSMLSSFLAFIINVVGNYYFIPILGVQGAAISTSISFLIFVILRTEFSIRLWIRLERTRMYIVLTLNILTSIIFSIFKDGYVSDAFIFINIIFCFVIYNKEIKCVINKVNFKMVFRNEI